MVFRTLKALVSRRKGEKGGEGIGGYRSTCQDNKILPVTLRVCQVNNTHPVTASKKYAMMQEMCEGK